MKLETKRTYKLNLVSREVFEMLLTVKETAELLRISERYTYQLIKKNKLPHIKLGGKILCDKQSLMDYLKSIEQASIKEEA